MSCCAPEYFDSPSSKPNGMLCGYFLTSKPVKYNWFSAWNTPAASIIFIIKIQSLYLGSRDLLVCLLPLPPNFFRITLLFTVLQSHWLLDRTHFLLLLVAFVDAITSAWNDLTGLFSFFRALLKCYPLAKTFLYGPGQSSSSITEHALFSL